MPDFKELIDCIRREDVTVFLGSGFSLKAGAPSGKAIANAIANAMTETERLQLNGSQLDYVSEEYEQIYGRGPLIDILKESMSFRQTDISDHINLSHIPHLHNIITTNYDTLIEDAYGKDNVYVVRHTLDCTHIPKDKTILYKIHGDFEAVDNIILTSQDYTDFFSNQKERLLWNFIQAEILTKDILFIGYSLEDSNIFEIMKQVKKAVNGNTRRFFLIAPGLKDYKIKRLAETNVVYYDAKAEDLFPHLFASLDKNIYTDYRKGRCSFGTLCKYCEYKKLRAIASESKDGNTVRFEPIEKGELKINFMLDGKIGSKLVSRDNSLFQDYFPDSLVPSAKIERQNIKKLEFLMNGMTVGTEEDISTMYIGPSHATVEVSISIPSLVFKEKAIMTQYALNDKRIVIGDMPSYTIKFELPLETGKEGHCSCNVTPKGLYTNNSDALKWIDLPIAIWGGEEVIISGGICSKLKCPHSDDVKEFEIIKKYYENIKKIELLYSVDFKEYKNYSNQLLKQSEMILQSHQESDVPIKMEHCEFTIDIAGNLKTAKKNIPKGNGSFNLVMSQEDGIMIDFNGRNFHLKCRHTIVPSCKILSLKQIAKDKCQLRIKNLSDYIFLKYTDKPINTLSGYENVKKLI